MNTALARIDGIITDAGRWRRYPAAGTGTGLFAASPEQPANNNAKAITLTVFTPVTLYPAFLTKLRILKNTHINQKEFT